MNSHRRLAALALVSVLSVAGANAITFSNILINGNPAGSGNPTPFGTNGLSFSLPSNFLVGAGNNVVTLAYRVDATPGSFLTGVSVVPVGVVRDGTVSVTADHTNGGVQSVVNTQTAGAAMQSLTGFSAPLSGGFSFFDVFTTIDLTSTSSNGLSHLSIYNVSYAEAVPEPASMGALALGLGGLILRRRKGKSA